MKGRDARGVEQSARASVVMILGQISHGGLASARWRLCKQKNNMNTYMEIRVTSDKRVLSCYV